MTLILSGTDGLSDVDGSAATPAIRGTDANTGIFFPAADTIAFSEGGVESMRIDSSGNVGIGTASPAFTLDVGGATANIRVAPSTATNNALTRYVNTGGTGYVGLDNSAGALTAAYALNIYHTGAYPITFSTSSTERMRIDSSGNVGIGAAGGFGRVDIQRLASTPYTTLTIGDFTTASNTVGIYFRNTGSSPSGISTAGSPLAFYLAAGSQEAMRIDSSGNLLVGTTSSVAKLHVLANAAVVDPVTVSNSDSGSGSQFAIVFRRNTSTVVGSIQTTNVATSYITSSDYRLKENIAPMTGALAKVQTLKPCTYKWKVDGSDGQGFIAHELQEVCPDAVTGEKDAVNEDGSIDPQGIDTSFLVATLTAAIQELKALVDTQASTITQLQADVASLQAPQGTP
jgi:hypothetical protein